LDSSVAIPLQLFIGNYGFWEYRRWIPKGQGVSPEKRPRHLRLVYMPLVPASVLKIVKLAQGKEYSEQDERNTEAGDAAGTEASVLKAVQRTRVTGHGLQLARWQQLGIPELSHLHQLV
jgi:hypothetical protein